MLSMPVMSIFSTCLTAMIHYWMSTRAIAFPIFKAVIERFDNAIEPVCCSCFVGMHPCRQQANEISVITFLLTNRLRSDTHGRSTCSKAVRKVSYRWRLYPALPSTLVCERASRTQPAMTWRSSGVVFPISRPGMSSSRSIQLSV